MAFKDTGLGFGWITILFHWLGAILMPVFVVRSVQDLCQVSDQNPTTPLAVAVCLLFAFRLYWRLSHHHPLPLGNAKPVTVLVARGVALGMLLAGFVLPLMYLWLCSAMLAHGHSLWLGAGGGTIVFWLYHLGITAFSTGLCLHLYGAYQHHFVLKDESLPRLLGRKVDM